MKLVEKEQVMFGMLKGIEQEKWYASWFEIAMKEMFKDPIDREQWMKELDKAVNVYDTNKRIKDHDNVMAIVNGSLEDDERLEREKRVGGFAPIIVRWEPNTSK